MHKLNWNELYTAIQLDFDLPLIESMDANDSFRDVVDWSSMNALILTARIKEKFGVDILPGELRKVMSFSQLLDLVNSHRV